MKLTTGKGFFVLAAILCVSLLGPQALAEEETATYRLTVQIHEAPQANAYYLFYFGDVEFARPEDPLLNRTVTFLIPSGDEPVLGISAYPSQNETTLTLDQELTSEGIEVVIRTDSPRCELRYYVLQQAREIGSSRDQLLTFPIPSIDFALRGMTVSINWPNWKYVIHRLEPEGAEEVMNPLFETDPYKAISNYWYFSGATAKSEAPTEVSVRLRTGAAVTRITRNQSIIIFTVVVCVPAAIFIAIHPPKRGREAEEQKRRRQRFRITDGRTRGRETTRSRYKVK
jgi:hypothetical protein